MKVNQITFGRGSSEITVQGQRELRDLADRFSSCPEYYMLVVGHPSSKGDKEANLTLAQQRADGVSKFLQELGVNPNRLKGKAGGQGNDFSVSFVVGQRSY
jgi:outer membrane protein OmpA-like peptidoglycan-associated protein